MTLSDPPVRGKTPSDTTITKNGHGRSKDNRHDDVDPKSREIKGENLPNKTPFRSIISFFQI